MEKQKQIQAQAQAQSPLQFTKAELAAAEQLIHLSESSDGATSACSASSSARSVNAQPQLDADVAGVGECLWRRNKRYRLISDLYASMAQIGLGSRKKENRKREVAC